MSDSEYNSEQESDDGYANARDIWQAQNKQVLQPRVIDAQPEESLNANNQLQQTALKFQQTQLVQVLTVDSLHRDQQIYPNPLSCRLMLPKVYKNISRIDIIQVKLLSGLYAFSALKRNTTLIFYDKNEIRITATIPDGTYTANALAAALTTAMNTAAANTAIKYKVTYNTSLGRFVLSSPGNPFRLPFKSTQDDPTVKVYADWGMGYYLGFGGAPQDLDPSDIQTASTIPRLNTDYIYLKLNDTENMNSIDTTAQEDMSITHDSTGLTSAYFGKLLMNDFGSYAQTFIEAPKLFQNPLSRLDRLYFDWVSKDGTAIAGPDSLSCDWHMTLRIYQIVDAPTDSSTLIRSV
jgi:hypothetical protein